MKVVGKSKSKVTLGSGKQLKEKDNQIYTIIRDGLRSDGVKFSDLHVGDSVLCWTEESAPVEQ